MFRKHYKWHKGTGSSCNHNLISLDVYSICCLSVLLLVSRSPHILTPIVALTNFYLSICLPDSDEKVYDTTFTERYDLVRV